MFYDVNTKYVFIGVILSILINLSECGSLSIFEQKKYKRYTDRQGLYSPKDDVDILNNENFKHSIYGSERGMLVEFYNSWCGYCQRFAPSWKALATDVKDWRDLVGIGAIDCANDQNNPICRSMDIMGYPTVKYFHENYKEDAKNLGIKVLHGSDEKEHRQKLLEVIFTEQNEGRGSHYPVLAPYMLPNLSEVFLHVKDVEYTFLIIQEPNDFIGPEVTMDLHKIKQIAIRYSFNNNSELIHLLNANDQYPHLFAIDRNLNVHKVNIFDTTREAFKTAIRIFLEPKHINIPLGEKKEIFKGKWMDAEVPDMSSFMHERERKALKERIKRMGDVIFQMDLETTLRYSLKHEIGNMKDITGEKLQALRAYIHILERYFPFGKFGHLFLIEIRDFLNSHDVINGETIAKLVRDAEKDDRQIFSSNENWLACKGSASNFRGYPCGLWKMFHYLTVNAADHSIGLRGTNSKIVLEAMLGYIKHFFGCSDCSQHFQQMALERKIHEVDSWDESILWLWSAHNQVNKRLSGDSTEDPEYPKLQYPQKERCPRCHNADDTWNGPEVLLYLKHVYNSINVRYIGSDTRILHLGLDGSNNISVEPGFFKRLDTSLCLILYIASFLLIIGLIRIFWRRGGYKKKAYYHSLLGKV